MEDALITGRPPPQDDPESDAEPLLRAERRDANGLIGAGLGIGAFGAATAAAFGAVCPVCIVATPLLVGAGAVKRMRVARRQRKASR